VSRVWAACLQYHGAERRIYSGAAGRLARLFDEAYRTHVRAPQHDGCAAFPHGEHWAGTQARARARARDARVGDHGA
jgi:hypothetical protein